MSLSAASLSANYGAPSKVPFIIGNAASAGASALSAAAQQAAQRGDGSSVSAQGAMSVNGMFDTVIQNAAANTSQSAAQAAELRKWQEAQNQKAMNFNAAEAAKNRDWQEMMSNTAHQREVRDLMAAGLNPVLSASGGNGASVGSGATASGVTSSGAKGDVDTSANSALVSALGSLLSLQSQLASSAMSAVSNQAIAEKNNATSEAIAHITGFYGNQNAQTAAAASRYAADQSAAASRYSADQSAAASRYSADQSAAASRYGSDTQKYIAHNYPNSVFSFSSAMGKEYASVLRDIFSPSTQNKFDNSVSQNPRLAAIVGTLRGTTPRYRYYNRGAVK